MMSFRSTGDDPLLAEGADGGRLRIGVCICISVLALLLIWVSLVNAHAPWKTVITSHVRAPATTALLQHSRLGRDLAPGLRDSHVANVRRAPSLTRGRSLGVRRGDRAPQPVSTPAPPAVPAGETTAALVTNVAAATPPAPAAPAPPPSPVPAPPVPAPPADPAPTSPKPSPGPPAPAPQPPPTTSSVEPLFEGDDIDDFAEVQAAPRAISEVPDPLGSGETVFKMTVNDKDVYPVTPTDNPRAQALSPSLIEPGDEFWLETKFMLPESFPSIPGWMSLVSIYGPPFNGSSPWQIEVSGNEFTWQRNDTYDYDVPWRMPLAKGRWVSVLLHERFAADGWVEMWIDGQRVTFFSAGNHNPGNHPPTETLAMATMDKSNNGGANSAKIMQYREAGMTTSATVYFGALKIGETRESVEG